MNTFDESKIRRTTDGKFANKPHAEGDVSLSVFQGRFEQDELAAQIRENWNKHTGGGPEITADQVERIFPYARQHSLLSMSDKEVMNEGYWEGVESAPDATNPYVGTEPGLGMIASQVQDISGLPPSVARAAAEEMMTTINPDYPRYIGLMIKEWDRGHAEASPETKRSEQDELAAEVRENWGQHQETSDSSTRQVWQKQFDDLSAALEPYVIELDDGTEVLDLDAPKELAEPYQKMMSLGYAKGWIGRE